MRCTLKCYRLSRAAIILLWLVGLPRIALPQNFPPIAHACATPSEALVGQLIAFSSAGSLDPDAGPEPLSFLWEFGDGATSTEANPVHAFAAPGAYQVSLTVSDGADTTLASVTVQVLAAPTERPPAKSSLLALAPDESQLWVVNPDSDSVSVLDVTTSPPSKQAEIPVGKSPRTLAFSPDGGSVFVPCQQRNELWVLDGKMQTVARRIAVGHQPYGVAVAPVSGRIVVSNQGDDTVTVISPAFIVEKVLAVGDSPRAIAITADGRRAFVSHFLTRGNDGTMTEINLANLTVSRTIALVEDAGPDTPSSGRGFPNLLSALTVDPAGRSVWMGGLKSNTRRGLFLSGEPLLPENTARGFLGRIDLSNSTEDVPRRIDPNNADSISAIAFSPNGRFAYVTHQGAGTLSVYDIPAAALITPGDGNSVPFVARIDLGHAPQGIVLSSDGRKGYVANFLSRNVMVLDLASATNPVITATISTTSELVSPSVANGKRLFYRSKAPMHSRSNYIACASCHADGAMGDGRTWDFTQRGEGLRNTIDLRGRGGMAHGPVHWSANFDELQDFENDIVNQFGGTGLAQDGQPPNPPLGAPNAGRSVDLDDLAAYMTSLTNAPASPHRKHDGTLTAAASRGKTLFNSSTLNCATCHAPPRFTDSVLTSSPTNFVFHNVGTLTTASGGRFGGPLTGLDTPSLIGVWNSAPYLHDGSAATLLDVFTTKNPNDEHGVTSGLSVAQLSDLTEYLNSIDGSGNDEAIDTDGDGMTDAWELKYGLNPRDPTDAATDLDGDGQSNYAEFISGTDPAEPNSTLRIRSLSRSAMGWTFSFPTVNKTRYVIESTESLNPPNWRELETISGDGAEKVIADSTPHNQRFYRIQPASD